MLGNVGRTDQSCESRCPDISASGYPEIAAHFSITHAGIERRLEASWVTPIYITQCGGGQATPSRLNACGWMCLSADHKKDIQHLADICGQEDEGLWFKFSIRKSGIMVDSGK